MGPLLLAIPIFRNSMVIHSLDKITSVFLHLAPGYTLWGIRNHSCGENWAVARSIPSFYVYLLYPSVLYLVWAIVYYLIIFNSVPKYIILSKHLLFIYLDHLP